MIRGEGGEENSGAFKCLLEAMWGCGALFQALLPPFFHRFSTLPQPCSNPPSVPASALPQPPFEWLVPHLGFLVCLVPVLEELLAGRAEEAVEHGDGVVPPPGREGLRGTVPRVLRLAQQEDHHQACRSK